MLTSQQLYQQAHQLPALEKLRLAELLLSDLDLPDSLCDKVWAKEAKERWQAYQSGKSATVSYDVVMEKYSNVDSMTETMYLLSSPANATHLIESIAQLRANSHV